MACSELWFSSAARLQGQVEGNLDSLACNAAGDFETLRYGNLAAASGMIELQAGRLFPVPAVEMEVRASWTPLGGSLGDHLEAWCNLLCTIAGLPPLPEGVIALPGQRR